MIAIRTTISDKAYPRKLNAIEHQVATPGSNMKT
jgi:hypothetical protein